MSIEQSKLERWEELDTQRLLYGLSSAEQREFDELKSQLGDSAESFENVVAILDVAWNASGNDSLPADLKRRVIESAPNSKPSGSLANSPDKSTSFLFTRDVLPWLVTAASLILAIAIWQANKTDVIQTQTASARREQLLRDEVKILKIDWAPGTTPIEGASGDVVWSSSRQEGYMRFQGLKVNDPTKEQYQLWIFDKSQSDKTPIDGGVFDIASNGEVVVPIDAKLRADDVFLFAVTIEKPGGVVVSSREKLPLLAKVE